ncbi:MAG TPA: cytochrome c oxidase subunit II [Candidatus Krumholzibacteria bacterium]|nr:cytochrome c oxidase subunit II [Candidatus Krumholzibacteria bacterium]HPD70718.1 cytochrome c oxidase subunit II [Candidatus Krumholzibacteria bacterium]HRY39582.1 cytochrome c oxidase subunit II [Candidatus Krumholzibacteria bacterium]
MNALAHAAGGSTPASLRPFLAQLPDSFWMPAQASSAAGDVDTVFYAIYWLSVFFFAVIVGLMAWFVVRYRRRGPDDVAGRTPSHNVALEITWTAIPVIVSAVLFVVGFKGFLNLATAPRTAYEISVTGQKWQWFFTYPNGHVSNELHVPVAQPVRLTMTSEDVIHSLWIPAFRVKKDVVPGRYNRTWFQAETAGTYPLLCTEYCGTGHSDMLTSVTVHEPGQFEVWLDQESNLLADLPPAEAGAALVKRNGCLQCHSLDGSAQIGPTFRDLFGSSVAIRDGGTIIADENYIRQSILEPAASVVAGFEPVMPTYAGKLKDQDITTIIAFLKTLSGLGGAEPEAQAGPGPDDSGNDGAAAVTEVP